MPGETQADENLGFKPMESTEIGHHATTRSPRVARAPEPEGVAEEVETEAEDPEEQVEGDEPETEEAAGGEAGSAKTTEGDDQSAEVDIEEIVRGIMDEHGAPVSVRDSRAKVEKLFTGTDAEKKAAKAEIDKILRTYHESFEDSPSGPVLRADVAGRALAMRGQRGSQPVTEDGIRAQVTQEYKAWLDETHEAADAKAILKEATTLKRIEAEVGARFETAQAKLETEEHRTRGEVMALMTSHFRQFPNDQALLAEFNEFMNGLPPDMRVPILTEGILPVGKIFRIIRNEKNMGAMLTEAFQKGMKAKASKTIPSGQGGPSGKGPAPRRTADQRANDAFVDAVVNGPRPRQSLDSLRRVK